MAYLRRAIRFGVSHPAVVNHPASGDHPASREPSGRFHGYQQLFHLLVRAELSVRGYLGRYIPPPARLGHHDQYGHGRNGEEKLCGGWPRGPLRSKTLNEEYRMREFIKGSVLQGLNRIYTWWIEDRAEDSVVEVGLNLKWWPIHASFSQPGNPKTFSDQVTAAIEFHLEEIKKRQSCNGIIHGATICLQVTISRDDQHRIVSRKAEKSSQQLLQERYEDGDREVGLLGAPSGKFEYYVQYSKPDSHNQYPIKPTGWDLNKPRQHDRSVVRHTEQRDRTAKTFRPSVTEGDLKGSICGSKPEEKKRVICEAVEDGTVDLFAETSRDKNDVTDVKQVEDGTYDSMAEMSKAKDDDELL
ncbi:hypothetical protein FNV43_RR19617 [Rhamnella rubrinervis]|uniref:Uncharacterized protein n=1 Tax=Rhamnella rubrinervis TaxID=2594499 RepID=A0A8K0DZK9_9ROSA|nr:hypothetical protein FNV43_RR19617 [Rhamnella rubrinervis]